jgi:ketosteroid isomerase-like protein
MYTSVKCAWWVSIVCIFLFISCKKADRGEPDLQLISDKDSLEEIIRTVFDNSGKLNLDGVFESFCNDSSFIFMSNGIRLNYNEFKEFQGGYFSNLRQQEFKFPFNSINQINQDNAIVHLVGSVNLKWKNGKIENLNIAETLIFKKTDESWKIVGGHESYSSELIME